MLRRGLEEGYQVDFMHANCKEAHRSKDFGQVIGRGPRAGFAGKTLNYLVDGIMRRDIVALSFNDTGREMGIICRKRV
jgi:hypothetical protein